MKIPKYWARASQSANDGNRPMAAACWQSSEVSVEDAKHRADARVLKLVGMLQSGTPLDRYSYGDRPLREEIVQSVAGDGRGELAVITRNLYGALILNASRAMFIDVDFAVSGRPAARGGLFRRLMGKASPVGPEELGLGQVRTWAAQRPDLGLRVYRTFAGLRCLVTNQVFDPTEPETIALLNGAGSDPLYVRLCQAQACFRARLTPKPWRCGLGQPPGRYPWTSGEKESRFRQWQSGYERSIQGYCVCRLLEQIGSPDVHPEVRSIIALHDKFTCAQTERPLA
jgi:hypothetical protein